MEDRYSSAFDEVRASDSFKERMTERMREMNEGEALAPRATALAPRRLKKRTLTVLFAAAVLLIGGTALALGISAMIGTRDRSAQAVASYQAVLEGRGSAETAEPGSTPYITYTQFQVGEDGKWLPNEIPDINVSTRAGDLTVRLENLAFSSENKRVWMYLWIEGEKPVPYALTDVRLSINGGEPIETYDEVLFQREGGPRPTPLPYADWDFETRDDNMVRFPLEKNPFTAGTTFTLTGKLNDVPFTLTYTFTEAAYEALCQTQLQEVGAIGAVINAIPDETIPVNVAARWLLIEEIAITDHFLYYTDTRDPSVTITEGSSRPSAPYDAYDDGMWTVVDGMITEFEFVSAADDDKGVSHAIYRSYFPYDDGNLPGMSLVSLMGVVFRVEWATGRVTGPRDEAEYAAWRKESMELSAPDYGTDYIARMNVKADTFTVSEVIYLNNWMGYFGLVVETDEPVDKPLYGMDRQPRVTVNGVRLSNHTNYIQTPNDFMGGSDSGGKRVGFFLDAPAYRLLPETFEVTVTYNGSSVTFTMHKSDLQPGDAQSGYYHKLFGF